MKARITQQHKSIIGSCHPVREVWARPSSIPRMWHDTAKHLPHLNLILTMGKESKPGHFRHFYRQAVTEVHVGKGRADYTSVHMPRSGLIYFPNPHPGNYDLCCKGNNPSRRGSTHLSLSSAAFSASSSFCRAVAKRSWARSNSSSTSWMRLFREATSLSA